MMEERAQMQAQMRDMQLMQQLMMQQRQMPPPFNNYQSRYQQNATFVSQSSSQYQNAQQAP
ncbi:hypothetical protein A2U01_0085108, partial [Trifolium medium]|nr:hypothetical protein [Trifolium medium]